MKLKRSVPARLSAAAAALMMIAATAGCANNSSTGTTSTSGGADKKITAAVIPGWTDQIASMYLTKVVLEDKGYTVDIKELSDIAPIYAGTAKGDIDLFEGAPERIQQPQWDTYKSDLEDLGAFATTKLFLAVPDYVTDVKSLSDLPANASKFDGTIYGIEPGAGMTKLTQDKVFPDYGLEDSYKLQASSTAAMLAELKKATDAKQPIVVSLWDPFWASAAFPVRALEDPKGSFGQPEGVHIIGRKGFSQDHPDVADMMKNWKLEQDKFNELQDWITNKYSAGQEVEATKAWLKENPGVAEEMGKHIKS